MMMTKKEEYVARAQFDAYLKQFPLIEQERILEERLGLAQELQEFQKNRVESIKIHNHFKRVFTAFLRVWFSTYELACTICQQFMPSLERLLGLLNKICKMQDAWLKNPRMYKSYRVEKMELVVPIFFGSIFVDAHYVILFCRNRIYYDWVDQVFQGTLVDYRRGKLKYASSWSSLSTFLEEELKLYMERLYFYEVVDSVQDFCDIEAESAKGLLRLIKMKEKELSLGNKLVLRKMKEWGPEIW